MGKRPDLDQVEGLSSEREALWARLNAATFLTDDEKRAAAGYGAKAESNAGGDAIRGGNARAASQAAKFNPNHDELGRFTFGDGGGGHDALSGGEGADVLTGDPGNDQLAASIPKPVVEMLRRLLSKTPKALKPSEKPLHDLLKPGGKELGTRLKGIGDDIRTVTKKEYDALKSELLDGAIEIPAPTGFRGKWYQRPDRSKIAVRLSPKSGETLEVIESTNKSLIQNGYKVHSK